LTIYKLSFILCTDGAPAISERNASSLSRRLQEIAVCVNWRCRFSYLKFSPSVGCATPALVFKLKQMAQFRFFRVQIPGVVLVFLHLQRNALHHLEPVSFQSFDLAGIVGQQPHAPHAEIFQNLRANAVIPQIRRKTETQIGVHRVQSLFLQLVGLQLVNEADAAAFLPHVQQHAGAFRADLAQRRRQLRSAIAAVRMKHIAGQALGMDAHEHGLAAVDLAFHQRDMFFPVHVVGVRHRLEHAVIGRQPDLHFAPDQLLFLVAIRDQIFDRDQFHIMLFCDFVQVRQPRHRAVFLDHFADDRGGIGAAHFGEIDRRLRVPGSSEHAAFFGDQRKHVPRAAERLRPRIRIDQGANGSRTFIGGNPRRRFHMIDGYGKRRAVIIGVARHHRRQVQLVRAFFRNGHADETAAFADHEIDHFRRRLFRQSDKIAFVFPVFIVDDDDDAPENQVVYRVFDGVETNVFFTQVSHPPHLGCRTLASSADSSIVAASCLPEVTKNRTVPAIPLLCLRRADFPLRADAGRLPAEPPISFPDNGKYIFRSRRFPG